MNALGGLIVSSIAELAKKGIKTLIENIDFNIANAKSVNIEASMNEMRGNVYALEGYVDKMKTELDESKVKCLNLEDRAITAELKADRAEQKVKELENEVDQLQKYFKGE